jgi:PiT family inorganic phosphate transporter
MRVDGIQAACLYALYSIYGTAFVLIACILFAALALAYANGANANFKGVASLYGSGTAGYATTLRWGAIATAAGSLAALATGSALLQTFSGRGLVPDSLATQPTFLLAAAGGAALANLLATWLGFPVSTTHMLLGGLLGTGLAASPEDVSLPKLWAAFVKPLLFAPFIALVCGGIHYLILKPLRLAPDHRTRALDTVHFLSGGAVCFARAMNDTPKMAAMLAGIAWLSSTDAILLIGVLMLVGGWFSARPVAETLAHKITDMNPGQGSTGNLTTAALVIFGTVNGLPLSTTHVTVGAMLGMGIVTRQAKWHSVIPVLLAWVITLPCAAALAALLFKVLS